MPSNFFLQFINTLHYIRHEENKHGTGNNIGDKLIGIIVILAVIQLVWQYFKGFLSSLFPSLTFRTKYMFL